MIAPELPPVDAVTAEWWDGTRQGVLYLQHCVACDGVQHYPRSLCIRCGGVDQLGWIAASGVGTVDTWTQVHRAPVADLPVPYVVARVRLAEGPILLTNLIDLPVAGLDACALTGAAVQLRWRPLDDGRQLPVFILASTDSKDET